jgi:hypothetical protein
MKKITLAALAAIFAASAIAAAGSKSYEDFLKAKKRVVARAVIGDKVLTTFAQGRKTWVETNALQVVVQRTAPVKYSKLKLINAAKAAGKWADLKSAIQAMDLEDEWQACQFITSDYPAYVAATNAVVSRGIASAAEVEAFMRLAEDD